jgi:Tfp pilus assembly protein PilW
MLIPRLRSARVALDILLEQARQAGYDAGYADGESVRPMVIQLPGRSLASTGTSHEFGEQGHVGS